MGAARGGGPDGDRGDDGDHGDVGERGDAHGGASDGATPAFMDNRELLFSVVYNMLGSVADTEDVLQETWLSWTARSTRAAAGEIDNPRAYLVRIAINHALARHAALSRRRETYVGPWLPEPLVTDAAAAGQAGQTEGGGHAERVAAGESVSLALLVVLETLSPLERAVFVLNEVFGYAHAEIAEIIDRSPAAVRQLAHRARAHVHARRPRYKIDKRVQRQVTERFIDAVAGGDLRELMRILAPDVTLWADGGGKALAVGSRPIHGRDRVARVLSHALERTPPGIEVRYRHVNGDPSAMLVIEDAPYAVLVLDLAQDDNRIIGIYGITNPDKLSRAG